jgi:predicted TIM-barrel fold metal-dependent hydrolase
MRNLCKHLTRRDTVKLMAGAGAALGLRTPLCFADAPQSGFLKSYVSGRTINVHAHLYAAEWWSLPPAEGPDPGSMLAAVPYFRDSRAAEAKAIAAMDEATRERYEEYSRRRLAGTTLEDDARLFLGQCDEAGIDTVVNLTTDNVPIPAADGKRYGASFETVLEANATLREAFPGRIITFAGIDPRHGAEAVRMLELAVKDYGCVGYGEMISTLWRTKPTDKELVYPLLEKAAELDIPWMNDATMPFGYTDPPIYEQLAEDFPSLQIALGGAGTGVKPVVAADGSEQPAWEAMLDIAERYDNVWLDLDDWQGMGFHTGHPMRSDAAVQVVLEFLRRALDGPAGDRIMYGSDYPVFIDLYTEKDWIEHLITVAEKGDVEFTPADWERFFSRNAMKYLKLEA